MIERFQRTMSAIFSNTLNSQMTTWSQCESKNNCPVLLEVAIFSALKRQWMAWMEVDCNLKKRNGQRFQVLPLFYVKIREEFTRNLPLGALRA